MPDETLRIIFNKDGILYGFGMSIHKDYFIKNMYHILLSMFRTMNCKLKMKVWAETKHELDRSITGIKFTKHTLIKQ